MTELKKTKTQKPVKKVIETEKISNEDKILGKVADSIEFTVYDYENPQTRYKVTNLLINNNPVTVSGAVIETFIGSKNLEAREELKKGAKKVVTKDINGNSMYKIEVL